MEIVDDSPQHSTEVCDPVIRKECVLSSLQGVSFLFFQTLQNDPLSPTGPINLSSLTGGTRRLFSLRHIWANQRLQQHLITAQALDVGEIMKHLIGETNIKVQKECSGREHREIASFCIQPQAQVLSKLGGGFLFVFFVSVESLVCTMIGTFQEEHMLLL